MVCSGEITKLHLPSLPFCIKQGHLSVPLPCLSSLHDASCGWAQGLGPLPRAAPLGTGPPALFPAMEGSSLVFVGAEQFSVINSREYLDTNTAK